MGSPRLSMKLGGRIVGSFYVPATSQLCLGSWHRPFLHLIPKAHGSRANGLGGSSPDKELKDGVTAEDPTLDLACVPHTHTQHTHMHSIHSHMSSSKYIHVPSTHAQHTYTRDQHTAYTQTQHTYRHAHKAYTCTVHMHPAHAVHTAHTIVSLPTY